MRALICTSLFTCISVALAATGSGARPAYPSHRMIRKRLPSPLFKDLHVTSEDPTTGKDLLSPVTDTFNSPDTMSDYFDKGHLTGPGSVLGAEKLTGPDSFLDADKLHLGKSDKGIDLSGIADLSTLPVVPSTANNNNPVTNLVAVATKGKALDGINVRERGILDLTDGVAGVDAGDLVASSTSHVPELDSLIEVVKEVHLGGRLRGRKVKRLSLLNSESILPLGDGETELSPSPSILDITASRAEMSNDHAAYGSPYQAARQKQAGLLGGLKPRI
ncbi:hypothetical protein M407DRAFT_217797 [Tulasnella calospora MUT 4182]|uniref:Uncharacterized protein n=1 Tax=Tulasnella calospora MUT 4182 TaxID=1051891 RepID=A0A0C3MD88_9AGAM|nr:hypothetical protein M407DRAFT_217797 [Tulasnella calospora MUT 4182]